MKNSLCIALACFPDYHNYRFRLSLFFCRLVLLLAGSVVLMPERSQAQWSISPTVNNAICTAADNQWYPMIISDGVGGAIIAWEDERNGGFDVFAQKINAAGHIQWVANGVAICTVADDQRLPRLISDGAGGAIITWFDNRSGNSDIYVQKINASGAVQWTANGVAVCTAVDDQQNPTIVSDGAGGAIVAWDDLRISGFGNHDIFAQKINASGAVQWTANGVPTCNATSEQVLPMVESDGAGGAIITWKDSRNGSWDIYARRINASGAVQWAADGVAIGALPATDEESPMIVSDGAGGAIITWEGGVSGNSNIKAQRINATGTVQWTANGVGICTATQNQTSPVIVSDGVGGAVITWEDERNNASIYAQKINASGVVQWTANGVAICMAVNSQSSPTITSDDMGGAIITWRDTRAGNGDIYAQKIDASGAVQWTIDGVAICTNIESQSIPTIVSNGSEGAIITWMDYRNFTDDIYAQKICADGTLGGTSVETQASNAVVCENNDTSFTVSGAGNLLSFQWQEDNGGGFLNLTNGGVYSNVTTATLNLTSVTPAMSGNLYRCIVSGTCAPSDTSAFASLTVELPVSVGTQPSNATLCENDNTSFMVAGTGGSLSYQWQEDNGGGFVNLSNGGVYSNVAAATLNITGAVPGMNGYDYRCMITNMCGSVYSDSATLILNLSPVVSISQSGNTLTANGGPFTTYQWFNGSGSQIAGETNPDYTFPNVSGNYTFSVQVTDSNGCAAGDTISFLFTDVVPQRALDDDFNLFPVPAQGILYLEWVNVVQAEVTIEVIQLNGTIVKRMELDGLLKRVEMDIRNIAAGTYFVKVSTQNRTSTKRMVVR